MSYTKNRLLETDLQELLACDLMSVVPIYLNSVSLKIFYSVSYKYRYIGNHCLEMKQKSYQNFFLIKERLEPTSSGLET